MIASMHLADTGPANALRARRSARLSTAAVPGLQRAELTMLAPLGTGLLPSPRPGRVGLFACWEDDEALETFLAGHPLARALAEGWRVRLEPTHIFGAWPGFDGPPREMDADEPAAVVTIGRLRLSQTIRFLRASAAAEDLALGEHAMLASTGFARPPHLVGTFSLWRSTAAMRAYAGGSHAPAHRAAVLAHARKPFHSASAFIRFRPYGAEGRWAGTEPLAQALAARVAL